MASKEGWRHTSQTHLAYSARNASLIHIIHMPPQVPQVLQCLLRPSDKVSCALAAACMTSSCGLSREHLYQYIAIQEGFTGLNTRHAGHSRGREQALHFESGVEHPSNFCAENAQGLGDVSGNDQDQPPYGRAPVMGARKVLRGHTSGKAG